MSKRQILTKEFKIEAVRLLEESDKNGVEISRELGVRRNQLYKWQKERQAKGTDAFKGPGRKPIPSDDKVAKLQKENDQLREEVEILKKAAAYFARELK
jgi:transposase